jgi:four helix bundle protein
MRSNCARLAFRFPTTSPKDGAEHTNRKFIEFLNSTRRSLFEDASMLLVFERLGLLESAQVDELLWDCDEASRKITNFSRAL